MPVLNAAAGLQFGAEPALKAMYRGVTVWTEAASTFAPVVVRTAFGNGGGSNTAASISSLGCDAIIVVCSQEDSAGPMSPSSNRGGTFTLLKSYTANDPFYTNRTSVWLHTGFTPDAVHTITIANAVFGIAALTGLNASGETIAVDQIATEVMRSGSPYVSNSITPTVGASLALGLFTPINTGGDGSTMGVNSPFGNLTGDPNGSYWACASATATLAGTTPTTVTFTNTGNPTNVAGVCLLNLYYEA